MSVNRSLILLLAAALAACNADDTPGVITTPSEVGADATEVAQPELPGGRIELPPAEVDPVDDADVPDTAVEDPTDFGPCIDGDEPGCPCAENPDCDSGVCVDSPDGKQCSVECVENCPPGWTCSAVPGAGADTLFICVAKYTYLCRPCRTNEDCGGSGARCLPRDDGAGSFCGTACDGGADCPFAYACEEHPDVAGDVSSQCVLKDDGAALCTCNSKAVFDGASTDCVVANDLGACGGQRACGANGLSSCDAATPVAETCNGLDDDCDESVDESDEGTVIQVACDVSNEYGTCTGTQVCTQGALTPCDAEPPGPEVCNGIDDDCSGAIDDGLGTLECGLGACAKSVEACVQGVPQTCDAFEGVSDETCNGIDDDCDGETDEALGDLTCGEGECAHTVAACDGGQPQVCNPFDGASPEACDLLDNDCDGETDEALGELACGLGVCAQVVEACVAGEVQFCNPFAGAVAEVCNGFDDDCDGTTDEGLGTITCGEGECLHTVAACEAGVPTTCEPLEGAEDEVCDGLDNDCNGVVDDGFGSVTCGEGVCEHTVVVCDEDGQVVVCDPNEGAGDETCNGLDDDCDGETDEDLGTAPCGAGECAHTVPACEGGQPGFCNPFAGAAAEVCDGLDNDCDGVADEALGTVTCGVGQCAQLLPACEGGAPAVCDPFLGAQLEICDGLDNDCDGATDEDLPPLSCGQGECAQTVPACTAGQPNTCDPLAGSADEVCDGLDNDCDGATDEDLGSIDCGVGECAHTVPACENGAPGFCDPLVGAEPETCDGIDQDCDGTTDEGACAPTSVQFQFAAMTMPTPAGTGFTVTATAGSGACGVLDNGAGFSATLGLPPP